MPHESKSNETKSPEPNRDIQIWPLIVVSARRCLSARDDLFRLGIVPLAVIFVTTLLAGGPMEKIQQARDIGQEALLQAVADNGSYLLLLLLCSAGATCLFAVNWLRFMALGYAGAPLVGLAVGGRHFRFLLFIVAMSVIAFAVALVLALLLHGFGDSAIFTSSALSMILWFALILRLSPRWIGIAIDAPMLMRVAWRRTRGQGFKLFAALLLIEIPVIFIEQLVSVLFLALGLFDLAPRTFLFVICTIELIRLALQLGVLFAAYPQFVRETV